MANECSRRKGCAGQILTEEATDILQTAANQEESQAGGVNAANAELVD